MCQLPFWYGVSCFYDFRRFFSSSDVTGVPSCEPGRGCSTAYDEIRQKQRRRRDSVSRRRPVECSLAAWRTSGVQEGGRQDGWALSQRAEDAGCRTTGRAGSPRRVSPRYSRGWIHPLIQTAAGPHSFECDVDHTALCIPHNRGFVNSGGAWRGIPRHDGVGPMPAREARECSGESARSPAHSHHSPTK